TAGGISGGSGAAGAGPTSPPPEPLPGRETSETGSTTSGLVTSAVCTNTNTATRTIACTTVEAPIATAMRLRWPAVSVASLRSTASESRRAPRASAIWLTANRPILAQSSRTVTSWRFSLSEVELDAGVEPEGVAGREVDVVGRIDRVRALLARLRGAAGRLPDLAPYARRVGELRLAPVGVGQVERLERDLDVAPAILR